MTNKTLQILVYLNIIVYDLFEQKTYFVLHFS